MHKVLKWHLPLGSPIAWAGIAASGCHKVLVLLLLALRESSRTLGGLVRGSHSREHGDNDSMVCLMGSVARADSQLLTLVTPKAF